MPVSYTHLDVYKRQELLQPTAVPGDVRFVDVDGNGIIDANDRTDIGKGMPDWTFGFNLGVSWKNFDLNMICLLYTSRCV